MSFDPTWGTGGAPGNVDAWTVVSPLVIGTRVKATAVAGVDATQGTVLYSEFDYKRMGDSMIYRARFKKSGAGGSVPAVSFYQIKMPGALQIDTAKLPVIGAIVLSSLFGQYSHAACGEGTMSKDGPLDGMIAAVYAYTATELIVAVEDGTGAVNLWSNGNGMDFGDTTASFGLTGVLPIQGWV